jgi:hypothetical protein
MLALHAWIEIGNALVALLVYGIPTSTNLLYDVISLSGLGCKLLRAPAIMLREPLSEPLIPFIFRSY